MNDFSGLQKYLLETTGKKIVATNGCFDILHIGHISMLKSAKSFGDVLIVGLNSDSSVRSLKGNSRPINSEQNRKTVLEELKCVDYVVIFNESTSNSFLEAVRPDIYVKAGDYNLDNLNPLEKAVLIKCGTQIKFTGFIHGVSTTSILSKI
jgi:rfaE bifunctional protein nucleotidyltransferase chain/domain